MGGIDSQEIGSLIDIHRQQLQEAPQSRAVPLSKVVLGRSGRRERGRREGVVFVGGEERVGE